jgi:hypothetical protein
VRAAVWLTLAASCGRIGFGPIDAAGDGPADADTTRPSSTYEGATLFVEHFDDTMLSSRGWYDNTAGVIDSTQHAPGSVASFQCIFLAGANMCQSGRPGRVTWPSTDPLYFSMWIKRTPGANGPLGITYWLSDAETAFAPPFTTHLTVMYGAEDANPSISISDALEVNSNCVKEPNGTVIGCGGNFDTYPFGEVRAVSGCNGVASDLTSWECVPDATSPSGYDNAAVLTATTTAFTDGGWHFVEGFFAMSTIAGGAGQPDGVLRYWVDGEVVFASDQILFRTGAQPQLAWNQLALVPYLNANEPAQTLWIDELTIAVGVR